MFLGLSAAVVAVMPEPAFLDISEHVTKLMFHKDAFQMIWPMPCSWAQGQSGLKFTEPIELSGVWQ